MDIDRDQLNRNDESVNGIDQDIDELLSSSDERPAASASGSGTGSMAGAPPSKRIRVRADKKKVELSRTRVKETKLPLGR